MIINFKLFENTEQEKELLSLSYYENTYNFDKLKKILSENKDININVRQEEGWTPLLIAVNNSNFFIANLLVDNGADPNIFSYAPAPGKFPFDNESVISKMIDNIVTYSNNLEFNSEKCKYCWKFLDKLLKISDLNKQTEILKSTPLIKIAMNTNSKSTTSGSVTYFGGTDSNTGLKLIRKFIKAGADITIKNISDRDFLSFLDDNLVKILSNEFPKVRLYLDAKKYNL